MGWALLGVIGTYLLVSLHIWGCSPSIAEAYSINNEDIILLKLSPLLLSLGSLRTLSLAPGFDGQTDRTWKLLIMKVLLCLIIY